MRRLMTAAVLFSAANALAQPMLDLELHAVTQDANFANLYDPGPITVDPAGLSEFSIDLFVRAHLVGDPEATGLVTFDGRIGDDGSGSWAASPLTNTDVIGFPFGPNPDLTQGRRGMTPDYRAGPSGFPPNPQDGFRDPVTGEWVFLPLSVLPAGVAAAITGLDDVYRVEWRTTDLTPRTINLTLTASGAGYTAGEFWTTTDIDSDTFIINIVPAPGALALMGLGGLVAIRRRR